MTIILTDDDQDEHIIFKDALDLLQEEINLRSFNDGGNLIDHLKKNIFPPDIIFLDINMPVMNGLTALRNIKAHDKLKGIPVVIYSTSSHTNDISKAYKQGAELYFRKETAITKLAEKLKLVINVLREKRNFAELGNKEAF